MTKIKIFLSVLACIALTNCGTEERFPLSKRYWDIKDYEAVVNELKFGYQNDEKLPSFNDPETRLIVEKLTDEQNFIVVLEDKELGLSYKNEVAESFFKRWRILTSVYTKLDRKDKYIYEKEMLSVHQFGLGLQLRYFELGNKEIRANADDPSASNIQSLVKSNIKILVNNFTGYLDFVNEETRFSAEGQQFFAEGITKYLIPMINRYPEADFDNLNRKVDLLLKKTKVPVIKTALETLKELIFEKINRKRNKGESNS
ncbi:MAG: hypothetical protein AAF611_03770 [Bacteroidota bacterium]